MANLLTIKDLTKEKLLYIIDNAFYMEKNFQKMYDKYKSKIMCIAFFEPSTRTKISFTAAAYRLGLRVVDFNKDTSSQKKGETIQDTMRILGNYFDLVVLRHPENKIYEKFSISCPLINGGDGTGEHPTQAITDLFTIKKEFGQIDGLNILIVGDLKNGRTVHSLLSALSYFDVNIGLYCPKELRLDNEFLDGLKNKNKIKYYEKFDISEIDVLYMTRVQYERLGSKIKQKNIEKDYALNKELLKKAKPSLKILHPLPRLKELPLEIDSSKYAHYFQQAKNGIFSRMAIIDYCLTE